MKKTFLILLALLLSVAVYCQNNFRYPISVQSKQITGNTIDTLRNVAYKVLSDNINLSTVLVELSDTLKGPGNYVTPYQYHTTVGQTDILYLLKLMGSEFKAFPVNPMQGSAYLQIANNTAYGTAIYLPIRTLITGIHIAVGNSVTSYTADGTAFNGYALYSLNSSTGVITKVAQTTDGAGNFEKSLDLFK